MKSSSNEFTVTRGESFSIDKTLINKDGSPYIISSMLVNPYFLITVSSNRYSAQGRYSIRIWCPVTIPRFELTNAIKLEDLKSSATSSEPLYDTFPEIASLGEDGVMFSAYYNGESVGFQPSDAVFVNSSNEYKYFDATSMTWKPYFCRIVYTFSNNETKKWVEQNYLYSIQLVAGEIDTSESGSPIVVDTIYPILEPTKMTVLSNLTGGRL